MSPHQLANIFTKSLPTPQLMFLRSRIGIQDSFSNEYFLQPTFRLRGDVKILHAPPPNGHKAYYSLPRNKLSSTLLPYLSVFDLLYCISELLVLYVFFSLLIKKGIINKHFAIKPTCVERTISILSSSESGPEEKRSREQHVRTGQRQQHPERAVCSAFQPASISSVRHNTRLLSSVIILAISLV
jgi:hypothetical protein